MEEPADRLSGVRNVLAGLSLSEEDFRGDVFTAKFSGLRAEVNELVLALRGSEGWLIEWLEREQATGAVLYAAAKANKSRNGSQDASPSDSRSRRVLIARFNSWVREFATRLDTYDASSRQPGIVAGWTERDEPFPNGRDGQP